MFKSFYDIRYLLVPLFLCFLEKFLQENEKLYNLDNQINLSLSLFRFSLLYFIIKQKLSENQNLYAMKIPSISRRN